MKFACLGYGEEKNWEAMSKGEQDAMVEECFAYDDQLLKSGQWLDGGLPLQSVRTAKVLRGKGGKVIVTDGPFAETKEQLGGFGLLEVRDMAQAVEIMSRHPGVRYGPFEIRPVDEETAAHLAAFLAKHQQAAAAAAKTGAKQFASLGYVDESAWGGRSQAEIDGMIGACIAFDEQRFKDGQWLGGIKLQSAQTAKTVRAKGGKAVGKLVTTDGPYAETKEHLGGVVTLAMTDIEHAVEVLRKHPALHFGVVIEIRPVDETFAARWEERQARLTTS